MHAEPELGVWWILKCIWQVSLNLLMGPFFSPLISVWVVPLHLWQVWEQAGTCALVCAPMCMAEGLSVTGCVCV